MNAQLVDVDHQARVVTDELAEELRRRLAPDRIITDATRLRTFE